MLHDERGRTKTPLERDGLDSPEARRVCRRAMKGTKMTAREKVLKLAARMGAVVTLNDTGRRWVATVDAPDGQLWSCSGCHCLVGQQWDGEPRVNVWQDLLDRMLYGLDQCSDPECECCNNTDHS